MSDSTGSAGSEHRFGLLIAYVLPGFVALWGLGYVSPTVRLWLSAAQVTMDIPTIGGFLYVTLASIALGMTLSAVRWLVIDWINEHTGLPRPSWDDAKLQKNLDAYNLLRDIHYRYYQFHANGLLALLVVLAARPRVPEGDNWLTFDLVDAVLVALVGVFFVTARDNLAKYYRRVTDLLESSPVRSTPMSNGGHRPKSDDSKPGQPGQPGPPPKPQETHAIPRPADLEEEAGWGAGKRKQADQQDT